MKTNELLKIIPLWKQEKLKMVKKSTYFNYCVLLEKHILPFLKSNKQLNNLVVQSWAENMMSAKLSVKTIKCISVVLNNIVKFAAQLGVVKFEKFMIKFPTNIQSSQIEILTKQQHKQVFQYVKQNFSFKNFGIYLCLSCGIRIGEVCALTWQDFDLQKQVVVIQKTLQRVNSPIQNSAKTFLLIDMPKTKNSLREIPLSKDIINILKSIIKIVNVKHFVLSNSEKPIEPRSYRNYYKRFMQNLGLPIIKFHGLRHTFATRCIESNCDYKTLSSILGHSNITTTLNLYAHPNLEQKRKCINKMLKCM